MSTGNFYYKNASKVFAIGLSYEQPILDEDGNETDENESVSCDEFQYQEQIANVQYHMEENKGKFSYSDYEQKSQSDNRNFSARFVGSLSASKYFGDVNIDIQINAFSRSGYYEGACLDWELCVNVDSTSYEDVDEIEYDFENGYVRSNNMNEGMLKIQAKNAQKWANKVKAELIEAVEKAFEKSSTCFVRVATFSNGETIYQKCE
jgi:hypothetical protein